MAEGDVVANGHPALPVQTTSPPWHAAAQAQTPAMQQRRPPPPKTPAAPAPIASPKPPSSQRRPPLPGRPVGPPSDPLQQHDLRREAAVAVAQAAGHLQGTVVVEAGAGTGMLSAALLNEGAKVFASERDPQRVAALRTRFADAIDEGIFDLHAGDALTQRLPDGHWLAVANPPFSLTAVLLKRWLLAANNPPSGITLVLQREAARKLCGGDVGGHSRSSALLAAAGTARVVLRLPRDATEPSSRVDLSVWCWRERQGGATGEELRKLDRLLERAFAGPHTVADALHGIATKIQLRRQGAELGWDPQAHPRTLTPAAWRSLAALLAHCGKL